MRATYGRSIVQVKVALLDGLAVHTLRIRQTEETLLEKVTGQLSVFTKRRQSGSTHSFSFQNEKAMLSRP